MSEVYHPDSAPRSALLERPSATPRNAPGAFFPDSHSFVISGGEFTSITNIHHSALPARHDFRMIPLGDLDLRHEVDRGIATIRHRRGCAVRVYSANIDGRKSTMTVALYQGQNSEEVWRRELEQYATFRHPNLVQIYATAMSGQLYATVFHDELLPLDETLRVYRNSPILTAYLLGNLAMDAYDAEDHLFDLTEDILLFNATLWIRASTRRLCVQVAPTADYPISNLIMYSLSADRLPQRPLTSQSAEQEAVIISALTLDQYHKICALYTGNDVSITTEEDAMVRVGAIVRLSSTWCPLKAAVEIANVMDGIFQDSGWKLQSDRYPQQQRAPMKNGWTRFTSNEIRATDNKCIDRTIRCRSEQKNDWLSQANHIFNRLHIASCHEEYVLVDSVAYKIYLSDMRDMGPPAYLFVCPLESLQSDDSGRFNTRPESPAYWALDPLGVDRLTADDAKRLGLPEPDFSADVVRSSWDERVYAGLRQFHAGKGFDPDSQDIARNIGVPLYQPSVAKDALFAHVAAAGKDETGRKSLYWTAPHFEGQSWWRKSIIILGIFGISLWLSMRMVGDVL